MADSVRPPRRGRKKRWDWIVNAVGMDYPFSPTALAKQPDPKRKK